MATNFPTALDSYAALIDGTDILEAADQNNVRDAIEAIEAKIGINGSAVATSHDYKIAALEAGAVIASGATVFNTTMAAANTFQDLDLSGEVGANVARCLVEVKIAGVCVYMISPKGYGGAWASHLAYGYVGPGQVNNVSNPGYFYFYMDTDASGVLRHGATSAGLTITIKLINYQK